MSQFRYYSKILEKNDNVDVGEFNNINRIDKVVKKDTNKFEQL